MTADVLCNPVGEESADARWARGNDLLRAGRWTDAADAFGHPASLPPDQRLPATLARNLAGIQKHRPELYRTLTSIPPGHHYAPTLSPTGTLTLVRHRADGAPEPLSRGPDPLAAARQTVASLQSQAKDGSAIALGGIADGHALALLAAEPPTLPLGMQQPIYLCEPDAALVLACLSIHDYTGPTGPVEQRRVHWLVGPRWDAAFERLFTTDLALQLPVFVACQSPVAPEVERLTQSLLSQLVDLQHKLSSDIAAHYAGLSPAQSAAALAGRLPRKPRVLLLTTRFSTVLQYSTRDTADAFRQLGFDPHVLIEPTPHHRLSRLFIRRAVLSLKPDLVFQLDHLRHEHGDAFPPNLPFACWIQDHLPNLMDPTAGPKVGPTDFVLTDAAATYAHKYHYPARQLIDLQKLTKITPIASCESVDDRAVTFVSNAAHEPAELVRKFTHQLTAVPAVAHAVTDLCRELIATYDADASISTYPQLRDLLTATLASRSLTIPPGLFDQIARWLMHPFNDALYRQQALRWAADACAALNLDLKLYGAGWEKHPRFAPHAQGPVAYGEPLAQLTRASAINLQIVPYFCLHQRLLDGLMAGGFFLVRQHPADVLPQALLDFLHARGLSSAATSTHALAAVAGEDRAELERLLQGCRPCLCSFGVEDPIDMVRAWERAQILVPRDGVLPRLNEIAFSNKQQLRDRLARFAADPAARQSIAAEQRQSVVERLSYPAGIRRVVREIVMRMEAPPSCN